jgi:Taurine catabolism dioxygenase TauD, TfdA family
MTSFESCIISDCPEQRTIEGLQVPFILSPPAPLVSAEDASEFVKANRSKIDRALQDHGAVLFRGFPLKVVSDFDVFVRSWEDWQDLSA